MSRFHDILGVRPDASQEEIKNAFRQRALECHPDQAADGQKDAAQEEFVRVREAFEVLSDTENRRPRDATATNGSTASSDGQKRPRRRPYKEQWKDYRNRKVHVDKDIVDSVRGQSREYQLIRQKNRITVPTSAAAAAAIYIYDPMMIFGSGVFVVDVLLCGLVGSVYGFVLGSVWAYLHLFIEDYASG